MLHEYPEIEQGTEEWHDIRRGVITASTVGRLITTRHLDAIDYGCPDCTAAPGDPCTSKRAGATQTPIKTLHPARTARRGETPPVLEPSDSDDARNLTLLLAAERITGWTDPTYMSDDMWRGVQDEPRAIDVYSEHFAPVRRIGFMVREEDGWRLGYSPDGLVGNDGLVEVKSRRAKTQLATFLSGEVPAVNMAQLQAGLLVTGRAWCDYISFTGGMPLFVRRVYPDPQWFRAITAAVEKFEATVADMTETYNRAIVGMPMTERVTFDEIVI